MKIAEIVAAFPPQHGGMGYVCLHNSLELKRLGHDVTVFTLGNPNFDYGAEERIVMGLPVVRLSSPIALGDAAAVPALYSHLKAFDVAHLHYPFYGGAEYVYLALLRTSLKYMITYHMDVYGDSTLKKAIIWAYEKALMKRIIRGAGVVGALSLAHLKSSKVADIVDWAKVVDMPNGIDAETFKPAEKDAGLLKKYNLEDKTVVLFVGNLQPFKRLDLIIDAIADIGDDTLALLVVGDGYNQAEYKELAIKKGLANSVVFAGAHSPEGDLPAHYNLGDFLVLPSTHSESFGLVVLEAMASGKPVIVSDLPGPATLVDEGNDGFIVKAGDKMALKEKIELLHRDPKLRARMGQAAMSKTIKKYNWQDIGARLERALKKIVSKSA
jgi:glycosyltransferase involved in cell wall biosynthesis